MRQYYFEELDYLKALRVFEGSKIFKSKNQNQIFKDSKKLLFDNHVHFLNFIKCIIYPNNKWPPIIFGLYECVYMTCMYRYTYRPSIDYYIPSERLKYFNINKKYNFNIYLNAPYIKSPE